MTPYLTCNSCDEPITFDNDHISERTGKKIPLDVDTLEPHDCNVWRWEQEELRKSHKRYYECRKGCGGLIYFDANNDYGLSETGKWIPLSKATVKHFTALASN